VLIAQITDLHLGLELEIAGARVDTVERLERAVGHLNALEPLPSLVLATGDLTADGRPEEYRTLAERLGRLSVPVFLMPGNHDHRERLRAAFPGHGHLPQTGFLHYAVEAGTLRILALDTLEPGASGGLLCERRLEWLEARLAEAPGRPTLIAMHHPPFATGIPSFDEMGCRGGDALGRLVSAHGGVEAVVCGHVHRAISARWSGTVAHVCPSAAFQYPFELGRVEHLEPSPEPPACMLHLWVEGRGLVSHLSVIRDS